MFEKNKILLLCLLFSIVAHFLIFFFETSLDRPSASILINVVSKDRPIVSKNKAKKNNSYGEKNNSSSSIDDKVESTRSAVEVDSSSVLGRDLGINVVYPRLSRELGEAGHVSIEVSKNPDEQFNEPKVYTSSGFTRLDEAALKAIREATKTGILQQALNNKDHLKVTFVFKLTEH